MAKLSSKPKKYNAVAETALVSAHIIRDKWEVPIQLIYHPKFSVDSKADFALRCIERWATVAAVPDGEDSKGRQQLRNMTPSEIVSHACDCSELAFAEFSKRSWLLNIPPINELLETIEDQENSNE
jgi:hypothetical protein